ncbi:MAG: hypothetical protein GX625_21755 [Clostridiaceae bacterium]|nr:hypothetical protein [Clostridiaceae bacterium]
MRPDRVPAPVREPEVVVRAVAGGLLALFATEEQAALPGAVVCLNGCGVSEGLAAVVAG